MVDFIHAHKEENWLKKLHMNINRHLLELEEQINGSPVNDGEMEIDLKAAASCFGIYIFEFYFRAWKTYTPYEGVKNFYNLYFNILII